MKYGGKFCSWLRSTQHNSAKSNDNYCVYFMPTSDFNFTWFCKYEIADQTKLKEPYTLSTWALLHDFCIAKDWTVSNHNFVRRKPKRMKINGYWFQIEFLRFANHLYICRKIICWSIFVVLFIWDFELFLLQKKTRSKNIYNFTNR